MILSSLALLLIMAFVYKRRGASFVLLFLLVIFSWRLISIIYIDLNAPVYSSELGKFIKNGSNGNYFGLAIIFTMIPFFFVLRPKFLLHYSTTRITVVTRSVLFVGMLAFVISLYADLIAKGIYPVFSGIERYVYARDYAGPIFFILFKYGQLIMAVLGACIVWPKLSNDKYDVKFLLPTMLIFLYCFLVGVRYSSYFNFASFLLIPFGALNFRKTNLNLKRSMCDRVDSYRNKRKKAGFVLLVVVLLGLSFISILNSYYNRVTSALPASANQSDVEQMMIDKITERIFIQQGELWGDTWRRVSANNYNGNANAIDFIFFKPGLKGGDTGIRYIMQKAIGRSTEEVLHKHGQQFAGGYPETIFEMAGVVWAWPLILIFNTLVAMLLNFGVINFNKGRGFTAFFSIYVFFAITAMYTSGTFTFLIAATFWFKIMLLFIAYSIESGAVKNINSKRKKIIDAV